MLLRHLNHLHPLLPPNPNTPVSPQPSNSRPHSFYSSFSLTDTLVLAGITGQIFKAKVWATQNKALAGIAATGLVAALVASAIPLWAKVIQPRLAQIKKDHAAGKKVGKRSVEEAYVDELIADEEFMSFLEELAEHMELE